MGSAETAHLQIKITGMHCEHCVRAIEEALNSLSGVLGYQVTVGNVDVIVDLSRATRSDLLTAIRGAGNFDVIAFSKTEST